MSGSESTNGIVFYILAALIGMAVGFVSIWSQIRGQSRQAKLEAEEARADLEKRIRDYIDLRLTNMQMSIDHMKESLSRLERKLNNHQQKEDSFS